MFSSAQVQRVPGNTCGAWGWEKCKQQHLSQSAGLTLNDKSIYEHKTGLLVRLVRHDSCLMEGLYVPLFLFSVKYDGILFRTAIYWYSWSFLYCCLLFWILWEQESWARKKWVCLNEPACLVDISVKSF